MLRSIWCDDSDAHLLNIFIPVILVKGTISIAAQTGDNPNNANKNVVFNVLNLLIA